jgi:hypothetical protein
LLLSKYFEHDPSDCDNGDEDYEVNNVVVSLVVHNLTNNPNEEYKANGKVLRFDKKVYFLYVIGCEEDPVRCLKSLESKEEKYFI